VASDDPEGHSPAATNGSTQVGTIVRARRFGRQVSLRLRIRALRRSRAARRFRLVRDPKDTTAYLSVQQVWIGRRLGRFVDRWDRLVETLRIQRSLVPERVAAPKIVKSLAGAQRGLGWFVVLLLVLAVTGDELIKRFGNGLLGDLGLRSFAMHNLSLPARGTLQEALVVTAGATGTILGIVLTVSLIVFQATAAGYRRPRIVAFLLRERVGVAVVRLLAVAFLYSLAMLVLSDVFTGAAPYVGTLISVALGSLGVVSLIGYRSHALAGYLPTSLFQSLSRDIGLQVIRASSRRAGRSVQAHAQSIATDDFGTLEDLMLRVVAENDTPSLAPGIGYVGQTFALYLGLKRRLSTSTPWYPRRPVRLTGSAAHSITEHVTGQGLMAPTNQEPDRDWFEREFLVVLRLARDGLAAGDVAAWDALIIGYGKAWQYAWHAQELDVADSILDEVQPLYSNSRATSDRAVTERLAELAWIVVETASKGFGDTPTIIVDTEPWANSDFATRLPNLAAAEALVLGDKIKLEIAVAGDIQTPRDWMIEDVATQWGKLEAQHRERYVERACALAMVLVEATVASGSESAPVAAEMLLRIIARTLGRGVLPTLDSKVPRLLDAALARADDTAYAELRETLLITTRRLAEEGSWEEHWLLLRLVGLSILPRDRQRANGDPTRLLECGLDALLMHGHSYAWAEFKGGPNGFREVGQLVVLVLPLDALLALVGDHFMSNLMLPTTAMRYATWFQSLRTAVYELPDRYVNEGGIGYNVIKDHPSELFQRSEMLGFDGDDAVEDLVWRLGREDAIARLIAVLRLLQEQQP
jgi:hypothetical protein